MNWQDLLNPAIQNFIKTHKNADVKELALKKPPHEDWNYPLILDQIKAHRKIGKIPPFDKEGIILPSADLIEQASSWACAQYKAGLYEGDLFIDLAAGSGADTFAFSKKFKRGVAVEKDKISADILAHNLDVLNTSHITIYNQPAENFVTDMPKANLVYCDPQRRNTQKRGIYDLSKCSPDIPSLLKVLKAQKVLIKTSPVLDIHKTVHDLDNVSHVHIIEYEGDCKELLFEITPGMSVKPEKVPIKAVQINSEGRILKSLLFTPDEERRIKISSSAPLKYLYEPSPAFQKSGGFHSIATHYDLYKLHPNTHLYTSEKLVKDFPGRIFKITGITQANSKRLKTILPDMRASLSVRNFPMAAKDLANKLKIKDGGEITLFACTSFEDQKIIIKCEKT